MKRIFILISTLAVCYSCAKEPVEKSDSKAASDRLSIETLVGDLSTRASMMNNSFADKDTVGIALYNTLSDTPYGDAGTPIAKAYVFGSGQWQSPEAIQLNEQKGTAYAYYPFTAGTNIERIPLRLDRTDYLWGVSSQRNLSADKSDGTSTASITMDHLLTRVSLLLHKSSYPKAVVSGIRVRSKGKELLCNKSEGVTFNGRTGVISGIRRDANAEIVFTDAQARPITDLELTEELPATSTATAILLPTEAFNSGELEFVITVNNKEFSIPVPSPSSAEYAEASGGWNQRFSYTYSVVFTGASMGISNVSLIPWVSLPLHELGVEINNPYKYSSDRKFCWYNKQEDMRVLPSESTSISFAVYSNQDIDPTTIAAAYPKQHVISSVTAVKTDMGSADYVNGERTLGQWRYNVNIQLAPNSNASIDRRDTIRISQGNAVFASIPLLHRKPQTGVIGFLKGFTLPTGMTLDAAKAEITITPYSSATALTIPLASNLSWNDSRSWSKPINIVDETGKDFRSFRVSTTENNTLKINTVPNVSGQDIVQYVVIEFDGGEASMMTQKIRIVHQSISQAEYKAMQSMCVEMGGNTWMQFNTTGSVSGDYQRAKTLAEIPGGLTPANIGSNFETYGQFVEYYNSAPACPAGFKTPTQQMFFNALGVPNAAALSEINGVATAPIITTGGMKISHYLFSSAGRGQALLAIEKDKRIMYLTNGRFVTDPSRSYFEFWYFGFCLVGNALTNSYNWAERCIQDPAYKGLN